MSSTRYRVWHPEWGMSLPFDIRTITSLTTR